MQYDRKKQRFAFWKALVVISITLNLFYGFAFWFLFEVGDNVVKLRHLPSSQVAILQKNSSGVQDVLDSISYAQQMGRLDIISLFLTFFGIIFGVATIGYFVYVRSDARQVAREEVKEHIKPIAESELKSPWVAKMVTDTVERKLKDEKLWNDFATSRFDNIIEDKMANMIASTIAEDEENERE
jgi:hypothetical protein